MIPLAYAYTPAGTGAGIAAASSSAWYGRPLPVAPLVQRSAAERSSVPLANGAGSQRGLSLAVTAGIAASVATSRRWRCQRASLGVNRRTATLTLMTSVLASAQPEEALAANGVLKMRQGMIAFSEGQVDESIKLFDEAADAGYPKALLWQRGLSLYYADKFQEGSKQFRDDVALNPNDTEESIWAMLCDAQTYGFDEARKRMLQVGRDPRDVMRTVYSLFRGEDEAKSIEMLKQTTQSGGGFFDGGANPFYAALYLGLYAEAKGDAADAKKWIQKSVETPYGKSSGDYMADLARVHLQVRGWNTAKKSEL